jgi:hypothetical protein
VIRGKYGGFALQKRLSVLARLAAKLLRISLSRAAAQFARRRATVLTCGRKDSSAKGLSKQATKQIIWHPVLQS